MRPDVALSLPCWLSQFRKAKLRQPTGQRQSNVRTQQKNSIGPILFLYYKESLVSSNLNSKRDFIGENCENLEFVFRESMWWTTHASGYSCINLSASQWVQIELVLSSKLLCSNNFTQNVKLMNHYSLKCYLFFFI